MNSCRLCLQPCLSNRRLMDRTFLEMAQDIFCVMVSWKRFTVLSLVPDMAYILNTGTIFQENHSNFFTEGSSLLWFKSTAFKSCEKINSYLQNRLCSGFENEFGTFLLFNISCSFRLKCPRKILPSRLAIHAIVRSINIMSSSINPGSESRIVLWTGIDRLALDFRFWRIVPMLDQPNVTSEVLRNLRNGMGIKTRTTTVSLRWSLMSRKERPQRNERW